MNSLNYVHFTDSISEEGGVSSLEELIAVSTSEAKRCGYGITFTLGQEIEGAYEKIFQLKEKRD